jgi:predicted nucleic acid-binding protein
VTAIVDTGPLVALLDSREPHHAWARETLRSLQTPLHTCEAVLSEACFLLPHVPPISQAAHVSCYGTGAITLASSSIDRSRACTVGATCTVMTSSARAICTKCST